jgi:uncharacterized protein (DUF1778 family)
MVRPKKEENRKHSQAVRLRLTPEQDALFRQAAERTGVTVSNWTRLRLLEAAHRDLGMKAPQVSENEVES